MMTLEQRLADAFLELADTLVDDFDLIEFLHMLANRTVELIDASAAGIMLADQRGGLQVMASSTEAARLLELFEVQTDEGPCMDAFRSGVPVLLGSLAEVKLKWPAFSTRLADLGFNSAQAIPMRLRTQTIGALNIFRAAEGMMSDSDLRIARALTDVATVGLLQQRAIAAKDILAEQLQTALNSRILLEQAKGVLAERTGLPMDQAFTMMRDHARHRGALLVDVARNIVDGTLKTL